MHKLNKILLPIGTIASAAIPVAMTVSCNMTKGFSVALYNYEDYISEDGLNALNKDFNYKMFGDLPEFEQAMKEGKTVGGIGSDYLNAKLAKQGELEKIDFHKALHIPKTVTNIEAALHGTAPNYDNGYYTPAVWKQLSMFDSYLGDVDHDGAPDHMWEYMVPYFTQSKVAAFNVGRGNWSTSELAILNGGDQSAIENMVADKSYLGILKFLKAHDYNKFINNDYQRDNAMIGSEMTSFTGHLKQSNYKQFTSDYVRTLKEGLGVSINNTSQVVSESSGTESLDHLLNPQESWDVSFLYNGDAQYAHIGGSKYDYDAENDVDNTPAGWKANAEKIRFFTPKNPVFLLDGFILSSRINDENLENKAYEAMYKAVFRGSDPATKDADIEATPAYVNYDYVGYTTPFNSVYKYVDNTSSGGYFEDDFVGAALLPTAPGIDTNKIIYPIDDKLQNDFSIYYEQVTKG